VHGRGGYFQQKPHAKLGESGDSPVCQTLKPKTHMALQFKVYETSSLEDLGTILDIIGENGEIRFSSEKNLKSNKRVTLILKDEDGKSAAVPCSTAVSTTVRQALADGTSKEECLAALVQLNLLEDDKSRIFISPLGDPDVAPQEFYKVGNLAEVKVSYEDLERVF